MLGSPKRGSLLGTGTRAIARENSAQKNTGFLGTFLASAKDGISAVDSGTRGVQAPLPAKRANLAARRGNLLAKPNAAAAALTPAPAADLEKGTAAIVAASISATVGPGGITPPEMGTTPITAFTTGSAAAGLFHTGPDISALASGPLTGEGATRGFRGKVNG